MRRISLVLLAALSVIAILFACCDRRFKDYKKTETGLYYKYKVTNPDGKQPQKGDYLYLIVSYHSDNDSIPKFEEREMVDILDESMFKGDIFEAYSMLKVGEEADFVIKADTFFFYYNRGIIPEFVTEKDVLYFTIKLTEVKTAEEFEQERAVKMKEYEAMLEEKKAEEKTSLANYIAEQKITVKPTASGLYYIEKLKGKGAKAENGKQVTVHYTGKFLDGRVFDSSVERGEPFVFSLGQGQVIKGWEEGIALMKEGGKATFIIPSDIAYGDGGGRFPPFASLVFEVELLKVSDAADVVETPQW